MRRVALLAAILASVPAVALAQWVPAIPGAPRVPGYTPPTYSAPAPRTTFDPLTGNSYRTTPQPNGGAAVQGYNYQTGSMWNTRIEPNGNQRGTDAQGNTWRYNAQTGTYMNTDGTVCFGKGRARTCSK